MSDLSNVQMWERTARQDIDYHLRQFKQPYRSTIALGRFLSDVLKDFQGQALDVGCGAGANIFYLAHQFPRLKWTGLDIAGEILYPASRPLFVQNQLDVELISGDFFRLRERFQNRRFDLVLSLQTLMTLPAYDQALEELLSVTEGWLVLTTPLTEFNVDVKNEVMDYTWPEGCQGPYYYSVFGLPRLEAFCQQHGCSRFIVEAFDIDIDLPIQERKGFATYTQTLASGRRLQFTGPVFLPWKFVLAKVEH